MQVGAHAGVRDMASRAPRQEDRPECGVAEREVHLELLLGNLVRDINGKEAGHIEVVRARPDTASTLR